MMEVLEEEEDLNLTEDQAVEGVTQAEDLLVEVVFLEEQVAVVLLTPELIKITKLESMKATVRLLPLTSETSLTSFHRQLLSGLAILFLKKINGAQKPHLPSIHRASPPVLIWLVAGVEKGGVAFFQSLLSGRFNIFPAGFSFG